VLQLLVNGLSLGASYALVAIGFVLIVNATGAVNFAQGDLVVVGGYTAVSLVSLFDLPGLVLLPMVLIVTILFGVLFSLIAYFPVRRRAQASVIISTIAAGIVIENILNLVYGHQPRATPPLAGGGALDLGGVSIDRQSLAVIGVVVVLIALQHLLLMRTRLGRWLRATAQDRDMAAAVGIPTNWMIALSFGLAAGLAGVAGLLLSNSFFLTPSDGENYILKAYVAVTIGGWGRMAGAVLGAGLIALFEVIYPALPILFPLTLSFLPAADSLFSQTAASVVLYVALLFILMLRPQGLLGERMQRRA
jgi:branched-chain amino acid transport system permease protein